jgi:hypothetical protein
MGGTPMANLERGVRRLTWVASLCFAVPLVGFGLLSTATGNTRDGGLLVILGLILAALSWIVFFTLRWIVGGFGNTGASEGEEDQESNEPISWWRHLLQPVVKPFCFSYYNRPHCGHPCVRKDSWGVYHVICGNPPVERVDVKGLEETLNHLKSGDPALAEVLPHMLSATIDENGVVPVCKAHAQHITGRIDEIFENATEQEQQRFKAWLEAKGQTTA